MTIKEIAEKANVSIATVSFVLNNKNGVSQETRERVMKIAIDGGYKMLNPKYKQVLSGNIRFLKYLDTGLIVEKNDGYISEIIDATEKESRARGLNLLLTTVNNNNFDDTLNMLIDDPPLGVIVLGTELTGDMAKKIQEIDLPMIVIDNYMPSYNVNCVVPNNKEIVINALRYLGNAGHKTIGYIRSNISLNNFMERNIGFREGLQICDLPYFAGYEIPVTPTVFGAYESLLPIFRDTPLLPTAFFCDTDNIAIGAIKALKEAGYRVPKEVSIIGFDDISASAMIDPPLTTMKVYRTEIAEWALQLLVNAINKSKSSNVKMRTSAQLVIRESTK